MTVAAMSAVAPAGAAAVVVPVTVPTAAAVAAELKQLRVMQWLVQQCLKSTDSAEVKLEGIACALNTASVQQQQKPFQSQDAATTAATAAAAAAAEVAELTKLRNMRGVLQRKVDAVQEHAEQKLIDIAYLLSLL
eukprot:4663-Heterococcus_DN1.PRE.1